MQYLHRPDHPAHDSLALYWEAAVILWKETSEIHENSLATDKFIDWVAIIGPFRVLERQLHTLQRRSGARTRADDH